MTRSTPLTLLDLPFAEAPALAWRQLRDLSPRFLLESADAQRQNIGRFSFLGFGPADHVRLLPGRLEVNGDPVAAPQDAASLKAALRCLTAATPAIGAARFPGGLVGCCGFDMVRLFEPRLARPLPPDRLIGEWLAPRAVIAFDNHRQQATLHLSESDPALSRIVQQALRATPVPARRPGRASAPQASISDADFLDAVDRAQEHIRAGDIFQLVLSLRLEGETDLDPFAVYRALRRLNPSPYLYYLDLGGRQVVGSSPEALVRLDTDGRATLRPIAGTRPRGATPEDDDGHEASLLADPKEAAEHVMLVDLARNDLGRVAAAGTVQVAPFRSIERYSHVMHIVSGVSGTLAAGRDALDLFEATFPAGTVSGAPKVRALELIDALEPTARGLYSGTVGYFGRDGSMDQAIAIRTLEFSGGRYRCQAGAGIVHRSVPKNELAECRAKVSALTRALTLAEEA
ncbi:MAG: anthranilate synthase component 1 [Myxococcota bacterium]|jgi:anthranilate synthase component 1